MKMCLGIPRCPSLNSNGACGVVSADCHSFGRISTDNLWRVMEMSEVVTDGVRTEYLRVFSQ